MVTHVFKNYLRSCRKKLGLSQSDVALILGSKNPESVSALELGKVMPTARKCLGLQMLFGRSFEELWPRLHLEVEAAIQANLRQLNDRMERQHSRSPRKQERSRIVCNNLAAVVAKLSDKTTHHL